MGKQKDSMQIVGEDEKAQKKKNKATRKEEDKGKQKHNQLQIYSQIILFQARGLILEIAQLAIHFTTNCQNCKKHSSIVPSNLFFFLDSIVFPKLQLRFLNCCVLIKIRMAHLPLLAVLLSLYSVLSSLYVVLSLYEVIFTSYAVLVSHHYTKCFCRYIQCVLYDHVKIPLGLGKN